jgi:hypothetical protein
MKNDKNKLTERFNNFHANNPQVYDEFKRVTLVAIERGFSKIGGDFIANIIRWESRVPSEGDRFKINNDFTAFYCRMFEKEYPLLKGTFRLRGSIADN